MSYEQPGPPTDVDRDRRDIEYVRMAQVRFCEGYHARMAEPHPLKRNRDGKELSTREPRWSFAESAAGRCPSDVPEQRSAGGTVIRPAQVLPAHERERWIAGFLHADRIGSEQAGYLMAAYDPARPPKRVKPPLLAPQEDLLGDAAPRLTRHEAKAWWRTHYSDGGTEYSHRDAGEQ